MPVKADVGDRSRCRPERARRLCIDILAGRWWVGEKEGQLRGQRVR
ncbi:MAG TPA: hypothetical protein VMM18_00870 [Gemmatimonadaceae bacterium]|nr:hypothetical protein [Gemmatimonadaceae bacterium]